MTTNANQNPNTNREYKIYIRSTQEWVPVTEDVYRAYYRDIWAIRKRAQTHGQCCCPKSKAWICDGDCGLCEYRSTGDMYSMDYVKYDEDGNEKALYDELRDDSPDAQSIAEDKELLAALHEKLLELDPDGRRICELLMAGKTERDIASAMGFASQSSVSHRKRKAFDQLRTLLHEYI